MDSKWTLSCRPLRKQDPDLSIQGSTYVSPPPLNLGHDVFLSHSGKDKGFVRILHQRLYHNHVIAFFDEKSLPKAQEVSMENILGEARRSKLGVLVLTEHFFTHTKNPMRELEAFVAIRVRLLPLFLGVSVDQFKEKDRRDGWEKQWRDGFGLDEQGIKKWREALDRVSAFSGLEYGKIATNESDYIDEIVKEVTSIVGPAIAFSEQGVCGMRRLCEEVKRMYEECASQRSSSVDHMQSSDGLASTSASAGRREDGGCTLDVVGIHGFAGLGKTTLCKGLCDFFSAELNGKVCYVDLARPPPLHPDSNISPEHARMLHVLSTLTGYNNEFHSYPLDIEQVKTLLAARISLMTDPVFLAIDNILPKVESQEEADFYLRCEFSRGSKIFITSRSSSILTNLTSQHSCTFSAVIRYMPGLVRKEARDILVHELPGLARLGFSNLGDELQEDLNACVDMCTIPWRRYHPAMLKSLAAYVKWHRMHKRDWQERLRGLRSEGILDKDTAWERVFELLDRTYNLLSEEAQHVFLELALLSSATRFRFGHQFLKSIWRFYPVKILWQLEDLGFIESKFDCFDILDLLVDFSKYKIGHQNSAMPRYVVVEEDRCMNNIQSDEVTFENQPYINPQYALPKSVRNVSISRCRKALGSTLDMTHMEELRVLHLVDNPGLQQVLLSSTSCAHLRILIVMVPAGSSLCFVLMDGDSPTTQVQAAKMRVLLHGNVSFQSRRCSAMTATTPLEMDLGSVLGHKLALLQLSLMPYSPPSIDVTSCVNLKELLLEDLPALKSVRCLANSHLEDFSIINCEKLREVTFSAHNLCSAPSHDPNLSLYFRNLPNLSCINGLDKSTSLKSLHTRVCFQLPLLAVRFNSTDVNVQCHTFPLNAVSRNRRQQLLGELLDSIAGVDPSICQARVCAFEGGRQKTLGPNAEVKRLDLKDAQHIGILVTALFNARPRSLECLSITCATDAGGCGCDQSPPHFGPLVFQPGGFTHGEAPEFYYNCPRVRDLESLARWHLLQILYLSGCTSVEVWPDFGAMTSLVRVYLNNTSLKEWPAGVQLLPFLYVLDISSCRQLSTQELMRVLTFQQLQLTRGYLTCMKSLKKSLMLDLQAGIRDKCSVVDAIDVLSLELVSLFDRSSASCSEAESLSRGTVVHQTLVRLLYKMWPFEDVREGSSTCNNCGSDEEVRMYISTKLRRLLCSAGFVSLSLLPPDPAQAPARPSDEDRDQWRWPWRAMRGRLKGIALVGGASFSYDHIAPVLNEAIKECICPALKWCVPDLFTASYYKYLPLLIGMQPQKKQKWLLLKRRVIEAVRTFGYKIAGVVDDISTERFRVPYCTRLMCDIPGTSRMASEANLGGSHLDFPDSDYEVSESDDSIDSDYEDSESDDIIHFQDYKDSKIMKTRSQMIS